jgi:tetratricopeptide (TPR) repeat protein
MDIYLTIEEKYLQAVYELNYGEYPRALQLLNEITDADPLYSRAHYQLGRLYYYEVKDYRAAGYHFKTCAGLEPTFPDVYKDYLHLLVFLDMGRQVQLIKEQALKVPGVNVSCIHYLGGLHAEKNREWATALPSYQQALLAATCKRDKHNAEAGIERVNAKSRLSGKYYYELSN